MVGIALKGDGCQIHFRPAALEVLGEDDAGDRAAAEGGISPSRGVVSADREAIGKVTARFIGAGQHVAAD